MKIKFHDVNTSRNEKFQILTQIPKIWCYDDVRKYFQVSKYMFTLARKLQNKNGFCLCRIQVIKVVTGCNVHVKRRLNAVAQGEFAAERRSYLYRREHYSRANPRCRCSALSSFDCCRLLSPVAAAHSPALQPATSSSRYLRA